jgi:hypothetical protein
VTTRVVATSLLISGAGGCRNERNRCHAKTTSGIREGPFFDTPRGKGARAEATGNPGRPYIDVQPGARPEQLCAAANATACAAPCDNPPSLTEYRAVNDCRYQETCVRDVRWISTPSCRGRPMVHPGREGTGGGNAARNLGTAPGTAIWARPSKTARKKCKRMMPRSARLTPTPRSDPARAAAEAT